MQAFLLIVLIQALVLLAVWWWDERTHRQERQRRHLEILQTRSDRPGHDRATPSSAKPTSEQGRLASI